MVKLKLRSQLVRPVLLEVSERGGDAARLIREFGLPADADRTPEVLVDLDVYHRLMETAAEAASDPFLGLHVAQQHQRGTFGLLEFILKTAPTIRDALAGFVRYASLQNEIMVISLTVREGDMAVEQKIPGAPRALGRHANEHFVAVLVHEAREAIGARVVPRRVWLAHAAPPDVSELVSFFGTADIRFDAGANGLGFDARIMDLSLHSSDPALFDVLARQAQKTTASASPAASALLDDVRQMLRAQLPHGVPEISQVARALGTSQRTLQRRLAGEGMSFHEMVDGLRRELAQVYLRDSHRTLGEIAFLLGYTELRAFLRAFKRWTGTTPSSYRKRLPA